MLYLHYNTNGKEEVRKTMSGKQKLAKDPVTAMRDRGPGFEAIFAVVG